VEAIELFGNLQDSEYSIFSIIVYPCEEVSGSDCDPIDLEVNFEMFLT
jgi:hypothetical protein